MYQGGTIVMNRDRHDALGKMLRAVDKDMRETAAQTGRRVISPAVRNALRAVPRHEFVRRVDAEEAYENRPLPIGYRQTISQPYIVALMTELLDLPINSKSTARLLEIGAGSGYQSAILSELTREVFAIEIVPGLAQAAETRLMRLGYRNITLKTGDGALGWPEHAPFDGIIAAAAAPAMIPALVQQLKTGAKMVIPLGPASEKQDLTVITRTNVGKIIENRILPVAFVPFTGTNR